MIKGEDSMIVDDDNDEVTVSDGLKSSVDETPNAKMTEVVQVTQIHE